MSDTAAKHDFFAPTNFNFQIAEETIEINERELNVAYHVVTALADHWYWATRHLDSRRALKHSAWEQFQAAEERFQYRLSLRDTTTEWLYKLHEAGATQQKEANAA